MASIACSTWDGGGNVAVFRALTDQLRARGHDVSLQIEWGSDPLTDGDLLLVDHMTPLDGLRRAIDSGRPVAAIVHTMWSFVPSLEGTFAPEGYLDALGDVDANLVFGIPELDLSEGDGQPGGNNVVHVGPVFENPSPTNWTPPEANVPLVVVSLGTTKMGELEVLQRVLDGLADMPVTVLATVGTHIDPEELAAPSNATVTGFISHGTVLGAASVFVGHAGHGGIMAALAAGLPIVSLPLDRDQPHNASRLASVGAGVTADPDADPSTLASFIIAALEDSEMRARARDLADVIARFAGQPTREIEALLPNP